jgi:hypothetical protein
MIMIIDYIIIMMMMMMAVLGFELRALCLCSTI